MIRDIWISLFTLGLVLFSWPIISIFRHELSQYLFTAWFIFIALIFIATLYVNKKDRSG